MSYVYLGNKGTSLERKSGWMVSFVLDDMYACILNVGSRLV